MVKIFVGNLPDGGLVTNDDIRPLFEAFGLVTECEIIKNFGFVHMDSEAASTNAIKSLNGKDVKGRRMKVERSVGGGGGGHSGHNGGVDRWGRGCNTQKIFVGNVADGTSNDQLRQIFSDHIEVVEADVMEGKNFGFVHIDLGTSAQSNLGRQKVKQILDLLHGVELNGNKLRIQTSDGGRKQGQMGDRGQRGSSGVEFRAGRGSGSRGGGHRGRRDAPYPSREGFSERYGHDEDYSDAYAHAYQPGSGSRAGPMRRGRDNDGYYGGYAESCGRNEYSHEQMFSRRSNYPDDQYDSYGYDRGYGEYPSNSSYPEYNRTTASSYYGSYPTGRW